MSLILSGTDGLSDVDGTAATPAIRGTDANTGIFFPAADTIGFSEGGAEVARFDSSGNFLVGTATPSASYGRITVSGSGISITPDTAAKFQIGRYSAGAPYSYIKMGSTSSGFKFTDPTDSYDLMALSSTGALSLYGASVSANGVGITFPATQSASSDANTLDDYEEGTWTPAITQSGATFTYSYQIGRYTKIGNVVTIIATLGWSAKSGGSGNVGYSGLPFSSLNVSSTYQMITCGEFSGFTLPVGTTVMDAEILTNTTTGTFYGSGSAVSPAAITTLASAGLLFLQCTYLSN